MIKKAFVMKLNPSMKEEYTKRHNPLWDEMEEMLYGHGIESYSIFLHEPTNTLFGYLECRSEELLDKIPETPICKKWWDHMSDIMVTNEDNSPVFDSAKHVFDLGKNLLD